MKALVVGDKWCVPMFESERGWGSKTDGYCGPFDTEQEALDWGYRYNKKYNSEAITPDWYIMAMPPQQFKVLPKCDYNKDLGE